MVLTGAENSSRIWGGRVVIRLIVEQNSEGQVIKDEHKISTS